TLAPSLLVRALAAPSAFLSSGLTLRSALASARQASLRPATARELRALPFSGLGPHPQAFALRRLRDCARAEGS
ncbi:MAG TPA: hypothetical protein VJB88_06615, partial [Vicinamibacteria bacterium]|nr:hypothetical protein [Vicinamibacteria bacterium]